MEPQHSNRLNNGDEIDTDFSVPAESQTAMALVRPIYIELLNDNFVDAVELPENLNEEEETVNLESPTVVLHVPPIPDGKVVSVQRQMSLYCNVAPRRRVNTPPKEEDTEQLTASYIGETVDSLPKPQSLLLPPIPYANISKPHEHACSTRRCNDTCRLSKSIQDLPKHHRSECAEIPSASSSEESTSFEEDPNLLLYSTYVNVHEEHEPLMEDISIRTAHKDNPALLPIKIVNEDETSATIDSQELVTKVPNYAIRVSFSTGSPTRKGNYEDLTERIPLPPPVYACLVITPNEEN